MNSKSIIDQVSKEKLEELINTSQSISQMIEKLGLRKTATQISKIKKRLLQEGFEIGSIEELFYFKRNQPQAKKKSIILDDILVKNSNYNIRGRKKELFEKGILKEECYSCGIGPKWNGKIIALQFDHINGDHKDNRVENLRILCPNCHSQTETYSGRNQKKIINCLKCKEECQKSNQLNYCPSCFSDATLSYINKKMGGLDEFLSILQTTSNYDICKKYQISLKSLTRIFRTLQISKKKPPRGKHNKKRLPNEKKIKVIKYYPRKTILSEVKTQDIIELINNHKSLEAVGRILNCTGAAIKKRIKRDVPEFYNNFKESYFIPKLICQGCEKEFKGVSRAAKFCTKTCLHAYLSQSYEKNIADILKLREKGLSKEEIAKELNLTPRSVRSYLDKHQSLKKP